MNRAGTVICCTALLLAGCSREPTLVVASKNFTEQVILGEILAQQIENRLKVKVDRKLNLGGTLLAHQALVAGEIDLYPEYTGTALTAVLNLPVSSNVEKVLSTVREAYRQRWNIDVMDPLGFNNTFAMVVRGAMAREMGLQTLSDAAQRKQGWKLGVGYEFEQRPDGLAGFEQTYHLPLAGTPKSMDLGLLYKALEQGQVDMLAASSTDGLLSAMDVRVLEDDKKYFPPYQAVVLVRHEALERFPGLQEALQSLSGKFTEAAMQRLNHEVDVKNRQVRDTAAEFLRTIE